MSVRAFALGLTVFAGLLVLGVDARGDDDDERHEHGGEGGYSGTGRLPGVAPVSDALWASECGSCHFAYPPGLLPERSWVRMLSTLPNHFGEDATVSDTTRAKLLAYAVVNAADVSPYSLSASLARAAAGTTPDRISTIPALRDEHLEELPASAVTGNPEVRSLANCAACHTRAAAGSFREGEIRIPGRGAWER